MPLWCGAASARAGAGGRGGPQARRLRRRNGLRPFARRLRRRAACGRHPPPRPLHKPWLRARRANRPIPYPAHCINRDSAPAGQTVLRTVSAASGRRPRLRRGALRAPLPLHSPALPYGHPAPTSLLPLRARFARPLPAALDFGKTSPAPAKKSPQPPAPYWTTHRICAIF